jgi:hypothetical protein
MVATVAMADARMACPRHGPFLGSHLVELLEKAPLRRATVHDNSMFTRPEIATQLGPNRVAVIGPDVWGLVDAARITEGCLRGGVPVIVVPVISGGSGGVFRTLLFAASRRGPRFIAMLRGVSPGHLRVDVEDGFVVERSPQDPGSNCCWNHDYVRRSFMVQGRLVVLDVRIRPLRKEPPRGARGSSTLR